VSSVVGNGGSKDIQGKYNGITIITEDARAIHDGLEFSIGGDGTIAKATSISFLGITGDEQVHFDEVIGQFSQGNVRFTLFEGPTITDNGTPITPTNSNFESTNAAELQTFLNPSVSANGTAKASAFLPLTGGGANVTPSSGGIAGGRVLKRNTTYLILIENEDVNTGVDYDVTFNWHESDIILD